MPRRPRNQFRQRQRSGGMGTRRRGRRQSSSSGALATVARERPEGPVPVPATVTVQTFADLIDVSAIEVIKGLMKNDIMATVTQAIDFATAETVAADLGIELEPSGVEETREGGERSKLAHLLGDEEAAHLKPRPPVVTIMGHVDHGKTSLLDKIRKSNVIASEHGGITQHIGAYQVEKDDQKITFLDTPGHEAFTAMRARGAHATDVVVLVVAADDGVMPQTREAIDHIKAADVPILVAINKIDLEGANPDRVKQELAELEVVVEDWGGDTVCVLVSAKTGEGIDELLENLAVVTEVAELTANPDRNAVGVVIEAQMDKNRGPFATFLVQAGTLKTGDRVAVGTTWGRVKAMFDDTGAYVHKAGPATPVGVLGMNEVAVAGDTFQVVSDEKKARSIADAAKTASERSAESGHRSLSLDEVYSRVQQGEVKELAVIVKTDVSGSIEPIVTSLQKLGDGGPRVRVIHTGPGNVTENDIMLAAASNGVVLGFNNGIGAGAQRLATLEGVDIRLYSVIYNLVDDVEKALKGMLEPAIIEVVDGHAQVRQVFKVGRRGAVAGVGVSDGKIVRSSLVRLSRAGELVFEGQLSSLRRFKDDVKEVNEGFECGLGIDGFADFQEGDIIEFYRREKEVIA